MALSDNQKNVIAAIRMWERKYGEDTEAPFQYLFDVANPGTTAMAKNTFQSCLVVWSSKDISKEQNTGGIR